MFANPVNSDQYNDFYDFLVNIENSVLTEHQKNKVFEMDTNMTRDCQTLDYKYRELLNYFINCAMT